MTRMMSYVEYVVEKSGLGKAVYFIASRDQGGEWIAGLFPAYMAPTPGEDSDEEIFDMAHPEHTVTGASKEEAEETLRKWIEETFTVHERRTERQSAVS